MGWKSTTNCPPLSMFAAENWWLEDYCPFKVVPFQGRTVSFKGGVVLVSQIRGKILSASTRRCRQHAMQVEAMRLEIEAMQDSAVFGFGEGT